MRKVVELGTLGRGRVFWNMDGGKYRVVRNLSPAGVSVQSLAERVVVIGDRTFVRRSKETQVWTVSAPVLVEVRG